MWYLTLSAELINLGGSKCQDGAVFRFHDKDGFNGLLLVHVDDFLCAGNQRFMTDVIGKLLKKYLFSKPVATSRILVGTYHREKTPSISIRRSMLNLSSRFQLAELIKETKSAC